VKETTLQTPRSVKKAGGSAQNFGAESLPLQLIMVRQIVPLQSMEVHGSPRKGPHARAGGCLNEAVTPWGAPHWSRLLPGPVDPWREQPTLE